MKARGFTLIELMITIALAAILMMIAVPGMRSFIINSSVEKTANDAFNALHSARSHAIDINHDVVVCYADASQTCQTDNYTHLIIFADMDADGVYTAGTDTLLTSGDTLDSTTTVINPRTNYRFTSDGLIRGTTATFIFNNTENGCVGKKIILAASGRARMCSSSSPTADCSFDNNCQ